MPLRKLRAADAATSPTLTASSFQPGVLIGQKGNVRLSGAFLLFNGIDKASTGTAGLESLGDFEASPNETSGPQRENRTFLRVARQPDEATDQRPQADQTEQCPSIPIPGEAMLRHYAEVSPHKRRSITMFTKRTDGLVTFSKVENAAFQFLDAWR